MVIKKHVPANVAIKKLIKQCSNWEFRKFGRSIQEEKYSLKVSNLGYRELWILIEEGIQDHNLLKPYKNRKETMEETMEKIMRKEFEEYKKKMIEWAKWKLERRYRYRNL